MRGITALIVTLVIAAIVGFGAYQLGVAQGIAGAGGATAVAPAVYYWHPFFFGGFGFLFPLLFFILIFFLIRAAFWGGGWGRRYGGWGRYGYGDPRDRLEEWHKQMHGEAPREGGPSSQTPPSGR
jgi:hypothetical protein